MYFSQLPSLESKYNVPVQICICDFIQSDKTMNQNFVTLSLGKTPLNDMEYLYEWTVSVGLYVRAHPLRDHAWLHSCIQTHGTFFIQCHEIVYVSECISYPMMGQSTCISTFFHQWKGVDRIVSDIEHCQKCQEILGPCTAVISWCTIPVLLLQYLCCFM